jgi:hypothetical protein
MKFLPSSVTKKAIQSRWFEKLFESRLHPRHCEERSDEAIHSFFLLRDGLLRLRSQ